MANKMGAKLHLMSYSLKLRLGLYLLHKELGISITELINYDTFLRFSKQKRQKEGKMLFTAYGRYIALKKYGLKFTKNSDVNEIFSEKIYTAYPDFIPSNKDVVVDVGAQYGDYAILCAKFYKAKVYTFEPLPSNFKEIEENIKLNDLTDKEIQAFNVALGKENKEEIISFKGEMANNTGEGEKFKVSFRTLDSYNLNPTILKIDVEGFEMDVLNGAKETIKKYKPKIIIETHSTKLEREVKDFLSQLNYEVKHEGRSAYNVIKEFDKVTNFFFEYKNKSTDK